MSSKYLFQENAFGDMYEDSFLADEFPQRQAETSKITNPNEAAAINESTANLRLIDAGQQANKAISSAFNIGGNLGGSNSNNFSGQIFGGI